MVETGQDNAVIKKHCTRCGKSLPLADYHKSKKEKDGRVDRCQSCVAEYSKNWWESNRERFLEDRNKRFKEYRKTHMEWALESSKQYRLLHRDEVIQNLRSYHKTINGKRANRKQHAKRKGFGYIELMDNPFPSDIKVDMHHINEYPGFVIPLPKILHNNCLGKKHKEKCNMWIQKLFGIDVAIFDGGRTEVKLNG